jgi:hypothetical protein
MSEDIVKISNQLVGNMGLYYICYELSKRGWNALPTCRNARGIDVMIYSQDAVRKYTIQVKALSKRAPVSLGNKLDSLYADYLIICRNVLKQPEIFIAKIADIMTSIHKGEKDGRLSYWLQPKDYEIFKDSWDVIGKGFGAMKVS